MANSHANNNHLSQVNQHSEALHRAAPSGTFKGSTTFLKALVMICNVWTCMECLTFLVNRCVD